MVWRSLMNKRRSFTLIELLIAFCLLAVIIATITMANIYFTNVAQRDIYEGVLYRKASYALERILREIEGANYLQIDPTLHILILGKTDAAGNTFQSRYYLDSASNELRYLANISQPAQEEVLLRNVDTFELEGSVPLGVGFRAARVTLKAKEPSNRIDSVSYLHSLAYCRIASAGTPDIIRLVDSSRRNEKGFFNKIQDAINAASSGDIIQVSSNNKTPYLENVNIPNNKSLTLEGAYDCRDWKRHLGDPNYETIIDGRQRFATIYFSIQLNSKVVIDGFTVRNGRDNNSGGIFGVCCNSSFVVIINNLITGNSTIGLGDGAGVGVDAYNNGSIEISNNVIKGNTSNNRGGGIRAQSRDNATLTISNNTITENVVSDNFQLGAGIYSKSEGKGVIAIFNNMVSENTAGSDGGGIYSRTDDTSSSIISNNIIEDNTVTSCGGGVNAVANGSSSIIISSNILRANTITQNALLTEKGGGIYAYSIGATISIFNNRITGNSVQGDEGGGLYAVGNVNISNNVISANTAKLAGGIRTASPGSTLINISNNTITGNTATDSFGGILAAASQTSFSDIFNNIITGNTAADRGGGIGSSSDDFGSLAISNNIITGNSGTTDGGGIWAISQASSSTNISNNTITGNSSSSGSGIYIPGYSTSTFSIINSIIYQNIPTTANLTVFGSGTITVSYSDIQGGYAGGTNIINASPQFVSASDYRLQNTSPCINVGHPYDTAVNYLDPADPSDPGDFSNPDPTLWDYGTAMAPAKGTRRNDMGAYGGSGASQPIGSYALADDPATPYIREDIIGNYPQ